MRDPETEATTEEAALFASIQNSPASFLHADQCKRGKGKSHLSEGVMSSDLKFMQCNQDTLKLHSCDTFFVAVLIETV